ncbi:DUF3566 domain-containing protein [Haematomicrobium sanguinis]|uniref:DUF3566 domain-containing protein n=1 Tax=Haematomicrobium sanguinis TaxID=479106 RepID=UPI00047B58AD|nr:DUF3566 domain-containing protein [Haematomicrobium sanguinis]
MSTPTSKPNQSSSGGGKPQARPSAPTNRPQSRPAGASTGTSGTAKAGAARPQQGATAAKTAGSASTAQQGQAQKLIKPAPKAKARRAKLIVSKIDTWSVLKMAFLLSVALGIVTVVAAMVLWAVLDFTGVFNQINELMGGVVGEESGGFNIYQFASLGQVVSFAVIIAVVNVVLLTALATLTAVLYNLSSSLVGGIGLTLTDD